MEVSIETVETGWPQVLDLFRDGAAARVATRHGISFDLPGLTVWLRNPNDLSAPADYRYPELIKDYRDRLFGTQRDKSLLFQRMRRWREDDIDAFDQVERIINLLRREPSSRSAVFSTWLPPADLEAAFPVSPVGGAVRVVGDTLHLFVTARSVDVWVGFVPELLAFAQLANEFALDLGVRRSTVSYQCWSAHLYEVDFLTYLTRQ
ncbi:thymidylate synthase [Micromonospora sp. NPDC049559]|uniref:thymidylate synthase n=1 Tax=Micromonospora sp. NPDC049559 TaxID=3155923 RepID=UPI00344874E7